jgi:ABC-type polysaccharide/polyol phosphate export permease
MFERVEPRTRAGRIAGLAEVVYHATVREVRKGHGNALLGLVINIAQTVIFVAVFYFMFAIIGIRGSAIRGDFLLYIMSGVFLFMVHNKTIGAVMKAEGPASPMMKHAPMNTAVAISAAALAALYMQVLSLVVVLFGYHVLFGPVEIDQPVAAMGMVLLSWFSGVAIGILFTAARPWSPDAVGIASAIYLRANMIASGKLFVANTLPSTVLVFFSWNPLFHTIDQNRGFVFLNYNPHYTSVSYPIYVSLALIMIGLMGEFYTRQRASASWEAKR